MNFGIHTPSWTCIVAVLVSMATLAVAQDAADSPADAAVLAQSDLRAADAMIPVSVAATAQPTDIGLKRPDNVDAVTWHIPELEAVVDLVRRQSEVEENKADKQFLDGILAHMTKIQRPEKVRLSLEDAVHRMLTNSHAIRIQSYWPAVFTTQIVQAEAAFDGTFFSSMLKNHVDQPSASQLGATALDVFNLQGGVRKRLVTGANVSASLQIQRQFIDIVFQQLNPEYTSSFVAEFSQPLLRTGGIDYNRAFIEIAKANRDESEYGFETFVRQSVFELERAYWSLVQARRDVVINARLLGEFEKIYDYLWQRRDFDTYRIQLSQTVADLETQKAAFVRVVNNVFDAQDAIIAAMNDPELSLAADVEIIPIDFPIVTPVDIDRVGSAQLALDRRTEIAQARRKIERIALEVGQLKNETLPLLDLDFRYTAQGLGANFDDGFDQVTQSDFMSYFVQLRLEAPIGNRLAKAAFQDARLRHAQAVAELRNEMENVLVEINVAARQIHTAFSQIEPSLASADANNEQVASVRARAERKDFLTLNQELSALRQLAQSRSALLQAAINYNVAIIDLERAKGTLLEYNNVRLADDAPAREP